MNKLIQRLKQIPKPYFTFADIRKIALLADPSLKISLNRLVKTGELKKITKGVYTLDLVNMDWENFACTKYAPSYLSFEWALNQYDILSQQSYALTLATVKRSHTISTPTYQIIYHHLQPQHFWGYNKKNNYLIAEPEKAFLDLAYLSQNGYAKFDPDEMNLRALNKTKLKIYLHKFLQASGYDRLYKIIRKTKLI